MDSYNYTSSLAVNTLDISPYVGFYYNISSHVYMEARYSNSITSALTHTNPNYTMDPSYAIYYSSWNAGHNLAFTLTLGVVFGKYGTALAAGSSQ